MEQEKKEKILTWVGALSIVVIVLVIFGIVFFKNNPEWLYSKEEILKEMEAIEVQPEITIIDNKDIIDKDNVYFMQLELTNESAKECIELGPQFVSSIEAYDALMNKYKGNFDQSQVFNLMNKFDETFFGDHSVLVYCYPQAENEYCIDITKSLEVLDDKLQLTKLYYSPIGEDIKKSETKMNILIVSINYHEIDLSGIVLNSTCSQDIDKITEYQKLYKILLLKE